MDEIEISQIGSHLYGSDGMARLSGGGDFDVSYEIAAPGMERLRFRVNATATRTSRREGANIVLRPIPDIPASLEGQLVERGIMATFWPRDGIVNVSGGGGTGKIGTNRGNDAYEASGQRVH